MLSLCCTISKRHRNVFFVTSGVITVCTSDFTAAHTQKLHYDSTTPINISQEGIIKLNWIWTCWASIRYDRLIRQEFSNAAQRSSEPCQYTLHITETLLVVGVTPLYTRVTAIIRTTRRQLQSQLQSVSVSFSNIQWLNKLFISFPDLRQRCTPSHSRDLLHSPWQGRHGFEH